MTLRALKILFGLLFLVIQAGWLSGCYTVVTHKKNTAITEKESVQTESEIPQKYRLSDPNSCSSCHDPNTGFVMRESSPSLFGQNSLWIYYYDTEVPWWVSHGAMEDFSEDSEEELGDTGLRRNYGRRREALNSNNASSSITTSGNESFGGGAIIPTISSSIPASGGTITTTISNDSSGSKKIDTSQTVRSEQQFTTSKSQNTKRGYGLRKDTKKK
jgi:hypothetical protein